MSELADTTRQLMEDLQGMGLEEEEDLLATLDKESDPLELDEDKQKRINAAFEKYRKGLRTAKGVIEELTKEKAQPEPKPAQPQVSQPSVDPQQQAQFYLATLQTRAMQKVGIPDPTNPLVQMEIQRQYALDASQVERQATAEKDAEGVFEEVVSGFSRLTDEDKEAIKSELQTLDPLSRADVAVVKNKVHSYLGSHLDKFVQAKPSDGNTSTDSGKAPAGAAAISSTKAQGSGVAPGDNSPGVGDQKEIKPPTAEEAKEMRRLGVPMDRPDLYRKAQKKKSKYTQT